MKRIAGIILVFGLFLAAYSAAQEAAPVAIALSEYKNDYDTASIPHGCKDPKNPTIKFSLAETDWIINLTDTPLACDELALLCQTQKNPGIGAQTLVPRVEGMGIASLYKSEGSGNLSYFGTNPNNPSGPRIEGDRMFQSGWLAYVVDPEDATQRKA